MLGARGPGAGAKYLTQLAQIPGAKYPGPDTGSQMGVQNVRNDIVRYTIGMQVNKCILYCKKKMLSRKVILRLRWNRNKGTTTSSSTVHGNTNG